MELKIGDKVKHKTTDDFTMVIMDNCLFATGRISQKDPERFLCKYYNKFTNQWEQNCFYLHELLKIED
ncbi:hypothetical protein EG347_11740 [Chryseobacterium sp. G0186]|uniref:hypothetical protein n=1 Tax=Chryseobacterium sp. G0186 TaxID=2487064 RepID=UPI000F50BBF2|nr:hypothetical protein [Chryseobacterium sp. G0186]AZA78138.1 hypothetical protein EG347_11740 [Chryseobacterium sp. G0186]